MSMICGLVVVIVEAINRKVKMEKKLEINMADLRDYVLACEDEGKYKVLYEDAIRRRAKLAEKYGIEDE